jgi:SAM-dependent methyltransferase
VVRWEPWLQVDDPARLYGAASGIRGTQRLVQCTECGMIYESPRFPDAVILEGYAGATEDGHDSQYPLRVGSFYRALRRLRRRLPPPGARVLDIGTAGGAFLDAAKRYGYDAVGLEPSRHLVERGQARGLAVEQGTIATNPLPPASFDLVCLWDVLEHVTDPAGALRAIRPLLKPAGLLLINFPDIGTWQARLAGRRFWWILSVHLHHFARPTLARLCARTGFQVVHFRRYWQTLDFGYLEDIAAKLGVPLARLCRRLTPGFLARLPVPYYASQTTALARPAAPA